MARSEGLLLRYLSDAYKALVQNVPEDMKSPTLRDISEWLGEMVRQVDSSLLDEWELLSHPDEVEAALGQRRAAHAGPALGGEPPPLTANVRAFRVMVRNACFRRAELAAKRDWAALGELDHDAGWDAQRWEAAFAAYFAEHATIGTGSAARGPRLWQVSEQGRHVAGPPGPRRPRRLPRMGDRARRRPGRVGPGGRAGGLAGRRRPKLGDPLRRVGWGPTVVDHF